MTTTAQLRLASLALSTALVAGLATPASAADRVKIDTNNNVVTEFGGPLRGAPFFMDVNSTTEYGGGMITKLGTYESYFKQAIRDNNLNAVRCAPWVGNHDFFRFDGEQSNHRKYFDVIIENCVQWAKDEDVYAILNYHTQYQTDLNPGLVKRFWDIYAPQYKNETHVVFELVNEPTIQSARDHMQEIHDHVRALAPNTHLILWSLFDPTEITAAGIKAATPSIDYSRDNVSVGWHNYRDIDDYATFERAQEFRNAGIPAINTEFWSLSDRNDLPISYGHIADNIRELEDRGFSWMNWGPYLNYEATSVGDTHDQLKFTGEFRDAVEDGARTIATQGGLSNGDYRSGLGGQYWSKWSGSLSINGSETPTPIENTVGFDTYPGRVDLSGNFTATANYTATARRQVVLSVFDQPTNTYLGQTRKVVQPGSGSVTLTTSLGSIPAGRYRLKFDIRDVRGSWRTSYQVANRRDIIASADSGTKPTITLNAADANAVSDGVVRYSGAGVGNFGPGAWVKFNRVDLGEDGYDRIRARISTAGSGQLEVRAQRLDGPVLATINFSGNSYDFSDGIWRSSDFPAWEYPQVLYFRVKSGWANLGDIQLIDN